MGVSDSGCIEGESTTVEDKSMRRHPSQGIVNRRVVRPSPEELKAFQGIPPAFLLDHMGKLGWLGEGLVPLASGMTLCGPAVTCQGPDLDVRRMAIDLMEPGDVLVVAGGAKDRACFGEFTARQLQVREAAGIVIDGATRDSFEIRKLGFPTFCKGVSPRNYSYPLAEAGSVNVPVMIGATQVCPGDLLVGDDDGVVCVPAEHVVTLASYIRESFEEDTARRKVGLERPFRRDQVLADRGFIFTQIGSEDSLG